MQRLILFCLQTDLMNKFNFSEFKGVFRFIRDYMAIILQFKILIFTFSYYFFCDPATHNSHGTR